MSHYQSLMSQALLVPMLFFATPSYAQDDVSVFLSPISPWQLEMAENKCRIARLFGQEGEETFFYLEQWDPSRLAYWAVAGPSVEDYRGWRNTQFAFQPNGDEGEFEFVPSKLGKYGSAVGRVSTIAAEEQGLSEEELRDFTSDPRGLPLLDSAGAEGIDTLKLSQKGRANVVLQLGDLKAPLAAMNSCMEDLVEHWGLNISEQRTVQSPPKVVNLVRVAREIQEYYPTDALDRGAQADFQLRLTIGKGGEIEHCVLLNQTLADDFDMNRHPCSTFKRFATVEPARNATGDAVRTYYTTRIIYRLR